MANATGRPSFVAISVQGNLVVPPDVLPQLYPHTSLVESNPMTYPTKTMAHVTNEELAAMVQRGFENTATKEDVALVRKELASRIDDLGTKLSAYATRWQEDFDALESRTEQAETDIRALNTIVFIKKKR